MSDRFAEYRDRVLLSVDDGNDCASLIMMNLAVRRETVYRVLADLVELDWLGTVKALDGRTNAYFLTDTGNRRVVELRRQGVVALPPVERKRAPRATSFEIVQTAQRVDRDPCPRCGVRADIGCGHRRVWRGLAVRA